MADARLSYLIDAKDRASATFKKVGGSARDTKKDLDSTSDGAKRLSKQIDDTKKSLDGLHKEFEKSGDPKFLKEIRKGERDLKNLSGWMQHFAARAGTGVKSATSLGDTLAGFGKGPAIGVLAAGAALAAVPALAAVSGAAVAGLGAGFIGLAAMSVKGSARVQDAASGLGTTWSKTMQDAGRGTERHFIKALRILQGTAGDVGPSLSKVFNAVTPSVVNLARGVDQLANNAMPGLTRAGIASADVLNRLEPVLGDTGDALSDFGDSLAGASKGGGSALVDTVGALNNGIRQLGNTLEGAANAYQFFLKDGGAQKFAPPIALARVFNDVITGSDKAIDAAGDASEESAAKVKEFSKAQREATAAFEESTHVLADYAKNLEIASGSQLGLSHAADDVIQSRHDLTESIKDNGTALVGNSEKAMANRDALRKGVEAANAHAVALEKNSGNQVVATAQRQRDIDSLRAWAIKQGMAKGAVDAFLASVNKVPPFRNTAVGAPGAVPSKAQVSAFNAEVAKILPKKGTQTYTNAPNTKAQIEALERAIRNVPTERTTTFYSRQVGVLGPAQTGAGSRRTSGGVGGIATGGLIGYANGGFHGRVLGSGTATSDSILARLSNGEFVTKAASVKKIGPKAMDYMNRTGMLPMAGSGSRTVQVTLVNHGVIGSQIELQNWLAAELESLRRKGRF